MVDPRRQTPRGQPVVNPGILLLNMLVDKDIQRRWVIAETIKPRFSKSKSVVQKECPCDGIMFNQTSLYILIYLPR